MALSDNGHLLGAILCKYCERIIELVDTEKVTVFYSKCDQGVCHGDHNEAREQHYEC